MIHEGAPDTFSPLNQNVIPNLNQSSTSTSITTEPETPKGNITRLIEQEFEGSGIRSGFVYVMYKSYNRCIKGRYVDTGRSRI